MYANPGTNWACPITIPCRNKLTIKTLTVTHTAITLRQYKQQKQKFFIVTQESNSNQTKARKRK